MRDGDRSDGENRFDEPSKCHHEGASIFLPIEERIRCPTETLNAPAGTNVALDVENPIATITGPTAFALAMLTTRTATTQPNRVGARTRRAAGGGSG